MSKLADETFYVTSRTNRLSIYKAIRRFCPWFTPRGAWSEAKMVLHETRNHGEWLGYMNPELHMPGCCDDKMTILFHPANYTIVPSMFLSEPPRLVMN